MKRELTNTLEDLHHMDTEDHPLFGDIGAFRRLRPEDYEKDVPPIYQRWLGAGLSYLVPDRMALNLLLAQLRTENLGMERMTLITTGDLGQSVRTYIRFRNSDRRCHGHPKPHPYWRPLDPAAEGKRRYALTRLNDLLISLQQDDARALEQPKAKHDAYVAKQMAAVLEEW